MLRFLLFALASSFALLALDYYVYVNWRPFARRQSRLRWTLSVYRVLMWAMPLVLPLYAYVSRWWEVEPKGLRFAVIGVWVVYYLPRVLIALVLLLKDFARFVSWLFAWFQQKLRTQPDGRPATEAAPARTSAVLSEVAPDRSALDLTDMKRVSRRDFLQKMGWSAASVPFVVVGYGVFRTLYDFDVRRIDVPIAGLPLALEGLTIAQLSDLHAGSFFSPRPMHEAVAMVNGLRPDVVAITGDFVNGSAAELPRILPALRELRADAVYGCLGNHDHYARVPDVAAGIASTPVDLLVNAHRTLEVDGARLHVIGTDNTGFNQHYADLPRALSGLEAHPHGEDVRVLLAHDPTFWDDHVRPGHAEIDLQLSGHTHGGQLGVELGPLRWSPARMVYRRWAGLYREAGDGRPQHLYVNRGLGTVGPPLRLGIRPEITLLTLRKA